MKEPGLDQGTELQAIFFPGEDGCRFAVGCDKCTKLIVHMEAGQCSGVPWIEVYKDGELQSSWNAVHIAGVTFLGKERS